MPATAPVLYTLTGTAATPWMDLRAVVGGIQVNIAITGTFTVVVDASNDVISQSDAVQTAESFSASAARVFASPLPRLFRFRATSGSGSAIISFGRVTTPGGQLTDVGALGTSNTPVSTFG